MTEKSLLNIVKEIESPDKLEREKNLIKYLESLTLESNDLNCKCQEYGNTHHRGRNYICTLGKPPYIGIGSHYDVVPGSPGANDNASAIAVTLDILRKALKNPLKNIGIKGFFFDGEENGLIGSRVYVRTFGINDLIGLYNMELVGNGNNIALWTENSLYQGELVKTAKKQGKKLQIPVYLASQISRLLTNSGDQESFIQAGLKEAVCLTSITDSDIEFGLRYGLISRGKYSINRLLGIARLLTKPPSLDAIFSTDLFKDYHQITDTSEKINEKTLENVSNLLYESILELDRT